jgi:transposase
MSLSSAKRYTRTVRQGDSLIPKKGTGRPHRVDKSAQALLKEYVKERVSLRPWAKDVASWST